MSMQRFQLCDKVGQRIQVVAVYIKRRKVEKFGSQKFKVALIKPVYTTDGEFIADHMWNEDGAAFADAQVKSGDVIMFTGVVSEYVIKRTGSTNYSLTDIDNLSIMKHGSLHR